MQTVRCCVPDLLFCLFSRLGSHVQNAKVVRGKMKLRKLAAIKDACYAAGLTKRGEDGKLIPIFQRGGL